jgi:cytochrome c biogenesis factor
MTLDIFFILFFKDSRFSTKICPRIAQPWAIPSWLHLTKGWLLIMGSFFSYAILVY